MEPTHGCSYEHDGLRCPKTGIYSEATRPDDGGRWYCAHHRTKANRGHQYADAQILRALVDDVREGKEPRGTSFTARETDRLHQAELARLALERGPDESRSDFIRRCLAAAKPLPVRMLQPLPPGPNEEEMRALLDAGEDPNDAL